jgi:predicted Zn-dependent peptidase
MALYADSPEDALQDEFDALVFANHPLGHNILGTSESVRQFQRQDFAQFIQDNIDTGRIIFSSVGNLPFKKVLRWAEKHLGHLPSQSAHLERRPFESYRPVQIQKTKSTQQAYCALGRTAYHLYDPKRLPFFMLVNLLGGPGMNSRLNLALRERHGFVYSVEAGYTPFLDTGQLGIYFATEPKHLEKSLQLVHKELRLLREQKLGVLQLHNAKEQLMGQMAMAEESNLSYMLMMGKSLLDKETIEPIDQIFADIRAVSAERLQDIAQEMLHPDQLSQLLYLPE